MGRRYDTVQDFLDAVEKRSARATGGRWRLWGSDVMAGPPEDPDFDHQTLIGTAHFFNEEGRPRTFNADWIAHSRDDLPAAAAALRAVLGVADELRNPFADPDTRLIGQRILDALDVALDDPLTPGDHP